MRQYPVTPYAHTLDVNRIMTHPDPGFARLAVDIGQTGFFVGREFRWVRKLTLLTGVAQWYKFTCPVPFVLFEQFFKITSGHYEFRAYRAQDVTDGGGWGSPLPSFGKNTSPERVEPFYVQQSTIQSGGAVTIVNADNYADFDELKTSGAAGQSTSIGGSPNSERYLDAGSYYLQFLPIGGAASGSWRLVVAERPQ